MKAFRRRAVVYMLLIAALLSAAAPAAFGGRGGGCHREPGYNRPGNCYLEGDFQYYNPGNGNISADCPNAQFFPHHNGGTVSADIDDNFCFNGGFCVRSDLTQDNETLVIDCRGISRDRVWLKDTASGNYYPIDSDSQAGGLIEIADNGWADGNAAAGRVEAEVLFSTAADSGGEPGADGESSGGGCNAASFGVAGIFAVLGVWGKRVLKKR